MIKEKDKEQYYNITVEALIPATITYKILATSGEEAILKIAGGTKPADIKYNYLRRKVIIAKAYEYGSLMIKFIKRF